jgi:nicotinate-nucleotide adenylyltransferase
MHIYMGGTYDPVHVGHLRIAIDLADVLQSEKVNLMPCYQPVHRDLPGCSAQDRLNMLRLAVTDCSALAVDDREIMRAGPSYTVDTLAEIRSAIGSDAPLSLVVGQDAFNGFLQWKSWRRITELAHLVVVSRPGFNNCQIPSELAPGLVDTTALLRCTPAGFILRLSLAMLDVSSTEIRQRLMDGKSVKYLLPDPVIAYIREHRLYHS